MLVTKRVRMVAADARCVPLQVVLRSENDGSSADADARSAQLHQARSEQEHEIQRLSATRANSRLPTRLQGLKLGENQRKTPAAVSKESSW